MVDLLRGLLERLSYRLMSVSSAKLEAQLQLEVADLQQALQERAAEYRTSDMEGGNSIATSLVELSERIGSIAHGTLERLDQERQSGKSNLISQGTTSRRPKLQSENSDESADRKRGRPRKVIEDPTPHFTAVGGGNSVTATELNNDE